MYTTPSLGSRALDRARERVEPDAEALRLAAFLFFFFFAAPVWRGALLRARVVVFFFFFFAAMAFPSILAVSVTEQSSGRQRAHHGSRPGMLPGSRMPRASHPTPAPTEPPGPFDGPSWIDRWLLPFVREPTLWPVLLVVVLHVVAFVAPMLLLWLRDGRTGALAGLLPVVALSGAGAWLELRSRERAGALCGVIAATWLLSAGAAIVADRAGIF